jgi:hypothetical protein
MKTFKRLFKYFATDLMGLVFFIAIIWFCVEVLQMRELLAEKWIKGLVIVSMICVLFYLKAVVDSIRNNIYGYKHHR